MRLENSLTPYKNSKWFKDLNIRTETIKLIEENISRTHVDIYQYFLDKFPKAKEIKEKINKWNLINFKAFAQQRESSIKTKDNLWNGENIINEVTE